jgi:site-specific DNA-methyltransferase (adenine-specific)
MKEPTSIVYNEDCMEVMKRYEDKYFHLAIVDPPYGIGFSYYTHSIQSLNKGFTSKKLYNKKGWDNVRPSTEYFGELRRVSKNQIIWGGNYFADLLPPKKGWIFWDKKITNANNINFSDGELAWTSFDCILRRFTYDWIGFGYLNNPQGEKKIHQTQKPVALYKWLLKNYAKEGDLILDTHLGSGSSRIACYQMGFDFVGCELDKEYYEAQEKRFQNFILQGNFFIERENK